MHKPLNLGFGFHYKSEAINKSGSGALCALKEIVRTVLLNEVPRAMFMYVHIAYLQSWSATGLSQNLKRG